MAAVSAAITEGDAYDGYDVYDGYRGADYSWVGWLRHTKDPSYTLRFFKSLHKVSRFSQLAMWPVSLRDPSSMYCLCAEADVLASIIVSGAIVLWWGESSYGEGQEYYEMGA